MHLFPALHRSRFRLALALGLVCAGLAAAIAAALATWFLPLPLPALASSAGLPAFDGTPHFLEEVSLELACLSILVAAVPQRQRVQKQAPLLAVPLSHDEAPPSLVGPFLYQRNTILDTSIYVDAENSPFADPQLSKLFDLLDQEIDNQPADRLCFMDATRGNLARFRGTYYRAGFQLYDVHHETKGAPHRSEGTETVNAVDVALAMHIIERALLGPARQKIILVSADRDYFPLLMRLKALGHRVQIWGRSPSSSFMTWCAKLGIFVRDLNKEPSLSVVKAATTSQQTATPLDQPLTAEPPSAEGGGTEHSFALAPLVPVDTRVTQATLQRAIEATLEQLQIAEQSSSVNKAPGARYAIFKTKLGGTDQNILREIGYDRRMAGWDRFQYWIAHLQALGILAPGDASRMPKRPQVPSISPDEAARSFFTFLLEVANATRARSSVSDIADARYAEVADVVAQALSTEMRDDAAQLCLLIQPDAPRRVGHMRFFCSCARQLGLVDFDEDEPPSDTMHRVR